MLNVKYREKCIVKSKNLLLHILHILHRISQISQILETFFAFFVLFVCFLCYSQVFLCRWYARKFVFQLTDSPLIFIINE